MSVPKPSLLITGATGHLGQLVMAELFKSQPARALIVTGRSDHIPNSYRAQGVQTQVADYMQPHTLRGAFAGVDRLLLISFSEFGQRAAQHHNVI